MKPRRSVRGKTIKKRLCERERLGITLEHVAWVIKKLHQHMHELASYRWLIYEEMGFGPEAYGVLQYAGLLDVHNALSGFYVKEVGHARQRHDDLRA